MMVVAVLVVDVLSTSKGERKAKRETCFHPGPGWVVKVVKSEK